MVGKQVEFQVPGEEPIKGIIVDVVTLLMPTIKDDQSSPKAGGTYYVISGFDNELHTINPACVQRIIGESSKEEVEEACFKFLSQIKNYIKFNEQIEKFNQDDKHKYTIDVNMSTKKLTIFNSKNGGQATKKSK